LRRYIAFESSPLYHALEDREELRDRIRGEVERRGYAVITSGELWAAFAAFGEDPSVSFDA
jgi:hypothetical protein